MAEEFTKSQLAQNKEIEAEKKETRSLEERVKALEAALISLTKVQISHKVRLEELEPLKGLIEFVDTIKAHFANFRLK